MGACCASCGSSSGTPCGCQSEFTVLNAQQFQKTVIGQMTCIVDSLRDLKTCLGARPYQVALVRTRWSGGSRGVGAEEVIEVEHILPTPVIGEFNAITRTIQSVGSDEIGDPMVGEISPRYTEDHLLGQGPNGEPIPEDENFYWEVTFLKPDGPAVKRRFFPRGVPSYNPTKFQWMVRLIRAGEDRQRNGDSE